MYSVEPVHSRCQRYLLQPSWQPRGLRVSHCMLWSNFWKQTSPPCPTAGKDLFLLENQVRKEASLLLNLTWRQKFWIEQNSHSYRSRTSDSVKTWRWSRNSKSSWKWKSSKQKNLGQLVGRFTSIIWLSYLQTNGLELVVLVTLYFDNFCLGCFPISSKSVL